MKFYFDNPFRKVYRRGLIPRSFWFFSKFHSPAIDKSFIRILGFVVEWETLPKE